MTNYINTEEMFLFPQIIESAVKKIKTIIENCTSEEMKIFICTEDYHLVFKFDSLEELIYSLNLKENYISFDEEEFYKEIKQELDLKVNLTLRMQLLKDNITGLEFCVDGEHIIFNRKSMFGVENDI